MHITEYVAAVSLAQSYRDKFEREKERREQLHLDYDEECRKENWQDSMRRKNKSLPNPFFNECFVCRLF